MPVRLRQNPIFYLLKNLKIYNKSIIAENNLKENLSAETTEAMAMVRTGYRRKESCEENGSRSGGVAGSIDSRAQRPVSAGRRAQARGRAERRAPRPASTPRRLRTPPRQTHGAPLH